jgi:hypothetical protein
MTAAKNPGPFIQSRPSVIDTEFPTKSRCGAWSDQYGIYWQADIVGEVNGATWAISMTYDTFSGAGLTLPNTFKIVGSHASNYGNGYQDADVWVKNQLMFGHGGDWEGTLGASGNFTVASNQRQGSIDVVLPGLTNDGTMTTIHVVGQWHCGETL